MNRWLWIILIALGLVAPYVLYPVFVMKLLCFALFACAFNLLLGYTGLLSFGHAAFLGSAGYATGWLVRSAGWPPELGVVPPPTPPGTRSRSGASPPSWAS